MKVLALKGYKSLQALNAFHTLILGVKMLPSYMGETYESFLNRVDAMADDDKYKVLREAARFVELTKDEVEAVVCFCEDRNGIAYQPANIKNLSPVELVECIVAVCFEISKMRIDFVSDNEKKNLNLSQ